MISSQKKLDNERHTEAERSDDKKQGRDCDKNWPRGSCGPVCAAFDAFEAGKDPVGAGGRHDSLRCGNNTLFVGVMQGLWRSAASAVENLAWRRPGRQLVDDTPIFSRRGLRVVAVGYCALIQGPSTHAVTTTTCEAH